MNPYHKLETLILSLKDEFEKFYEKNNKKAGIRVRKGMQEVKVFAQEIRTEVQNIKNQQEKDQKEKKVDKK